MEEKQEYNATGILSVIILASFIFSILSFIDIEAIYFTRLLITLSPIYVLIDFLIYIITRK
jgi:hypothetical protein